MRQQEMIFSKAAKQVVLFCCLLLLSMVTKAQFSPYNLVPNPSFEQYNFCPSDNSLYTALNSKPDAWYKPDKRGARYYNACANNNVTGMPYNAGAGDDFQYARTGDGYVAMFYYNGMDARNYIQVELSDSLRQGRCYYAEYYVNLLNSFRFGCNNQSMLFTKDPIYVDTNAVPAVYILPATPQIQNTRIITDTLKWVKVCGVFTAQGGEKFLTLGNFHYNSQTATQQIQATGYLGAAYYLEDVSVIPLDSLPLRADAGEDRTIPAGSSTYIGSYTMGLTNVTWYNSAGALIATNVPGLNVSPTSNTFYVIEQTVCGYTSSDSVYISVQPLPLNFLDYLVIAMPGSVLNKWTTVNESNVAYFNVQRSSDGIFFYTINKVAAKNNAYNEYSLLDIKPVKGVGYYRIECVETDGSKYFSSIKMIKSEGVGESIIAYPNPVTGVLKLQCNGMKQLQVTDISGRVVIDGIPGNCVMINVADLCKGIYLIRGISESGMVLVQKFLKQ